MMKIKNDFRENIKSFLSKVIHKECFLWLREDKTESDENNLTDLKNTPQEERTRCHLVFQKSGAENEKLFVVGHHRAPTRESPEECEGTRPETLRSKLRLAGRKR